MMSLPLARVFQSLVTFTYVMCWLAEIWQLWRRATGPVSGVRIEECGAKEEKTWFPGFSPTRPTERERERALSLSRSAGRVGENPGNEVEEESEKKTKEEKRARERERNLPSLSLLPHPLVVVTFFFCSHLFSLSPPLGYLWPHEPVTDLSMANFNGQACHDISLVSVRSCRWSRACIVPQQHIIVREGVYLFIYAHEVKDTDCLA